MFHLESINDTSTHAPSLAEPIHLSSLSFLTSTHCHKPNEISILSLGSSHVLLAGISSSSIPEIVLLLWDLQYAVLLASNTLPIPSTMSYSKESSIRLNLVAANASQVLLVLCPISDSPGTKSRTHSSPSHSSVLVLPLTVPATSTISNAMGRANDGMRWLAKDTGSTLSQNDAAREELLKVMHTAMEQNRPAAATAAFFEWKRLETKGDQKTETSGANSDRGKPVRAFCCRFTISD
jgi:hypothetical protein